jgi:phosphate acetyltransferase
MADESRPIRIVFATAREDNVLVAADRLERDGRVHPVILGDQAEIASRAGRLGLGGCRLEVVRPAANPAYRDIWLGQRASGGLRAVEAGASLATPETFAEAMLGSGDAAAMISAPRPAGSRATGACFFLVGRGHEGDHQLVGAPRAPGVPRAHGLAATALSSARAYERLMESRPEVRFLAPGIPIMERPGRFRSAREALETRVREAIETVRARDPGLQVADRLAFGGEAPREAQGCVVLTHSEGGDLGGRVASLMGVEAVVGPVCQESGETWGELSGARTVDAIVELVLLTARLASESA